MERAYHRWFSPHVHRDMELLVFGHAGARVIVFPTRDGRFYDYENWRIVEAVRDKIEAGYIQLFCVDSHDRFGLYADWMRASDRIREQTAYESYILNEVLPFSESLNDNSFVIAHGCSMGAFHATSIALRHPTRFGKIVAFSGRYDLTLNVGSFRDLFDGHYSDTLYYYLPSHFVPALEDETVLAPLRRLEIILTIGRDDVFLQNNQEFADALWSKGIPNTLYVWDEEAHRPRSWRPMAALYL